MMDATIACWDSKYTYRFWRPVTAIPLADTDGNDATEADPAWTPLRPTPLHPEYPSAHSSVSTAAAKVQTSFFGHPAAFSTTTSTCPAGVVRSYDSFHAMADEIGDSRVYIGFHFPQRRPRRRASRPPRRPLDVPPLSATAAAPSLHNVLIRA